MNFDPDLIETEESRAILAKIIAETLDADNTQPVPSRDNWLGEKMLRDLESEVVQKRKRYSEFAQLCITAQAMANERTVSDLLVLGYLNGLRRLPEGERQDPYVAEIIKSAKERIDKLEDSPRKARLLSLWSYHSGIYASVIGDYKLAAESQELSAQIASDAGDEASAVISRFRGAVEYVNDALVSGSTAQPLVKLVRAGFELDRFLKDRYGDPTATRWVHVLKPVHLLTAHFWAGAEFEGYWENKRLFEISEIDPDLARSLEGMINIGRAIFALSQNFPESAEARALTVIQDKVPRPAPMYVATMFLILAEVETLNGRTQKAKHYLEAAVEVEGEAHQVRAVAKRKLEQLN